MDKKSALKSIKTFKNEDKIGEPTPHKDRYGNIIKIGDFIKWYFCAHPISNDPKCGQYSHKQRFDDYTLMEDIVVEEDGTYYSYDPMFGGGFLGVCAEHCTVTGNVNENKI